MFLFTWEEPFLLDKELKRWKDWFVSKRWKENVLTFDSTNFDSNRIIQSVFASSLFASDSFVIIKWLPIDNTEWNKMKVSDVQTFVDEFLRKEWNISEWCWLIFVSYNPDKRNKLFKFLKDRATVKTFAKVTGMSLMKLVKEELQDFEVSDDDIKYFIGAIGTELYRLYSELDKLKTFCTAKSITKIDKTLIDETCYGNITQDAFKFFGILFKDKARALDFVEHQKQQWTNWNLFTWLLYWGLKIYLNLLDQFSQWITDWKVIAQKIGQNSFVLNRHLGYKDQIIKNAEQLKNMFIKLVELDSNIKTWKKNEYEFWLELKNIINKFDN